MGDIQLSNLKDGWLYILTDFAATLNLRAGQALNCATDGHAVVCNFCLYRRRVVRVKATNEDEQEDEYEDIVIYTVDVHSMASSTSPGKKNDHAMHNATFEASLNTTSASSSRSTQPSL